MQAEFELFDHTADIGVRVRGATLADLVAPATAGLYAVIGDMTPAGDGEPRSFEFTGDDAALLLRDYLADVLYLFDREHRCLSDVRVAAFDSRTLHVTGRVRPIDLARSQLLREVKAVTYHELAIRPVAGGFEATYIVDI